MQRRNLLSHFSLGCLGSLASLPALATQPPAMWLANLYQGNEKLTDYWVSEKYDGIRGYWDGRQLLSRSGKALNPPNWFVQTWPTQPFEGELWAGLGQFEQAASVIQQKQASDSAWRAMRFMIFDAHTPTQAFAERIVRYQNIVKQIGKPWVQAVTQSQVPSHAALKAMLSKTVQAGGEGLVLHLGSSLYQSGRNSDVLKVKLHADAEAKVVSHEAGQGKHAQRLGALWVETPQGLRFKLGTGYTDAQRENPPDVGQWVTYRYRGLTDQGVPRFASFVRIRPAVER
ncbi:MULTISPECIES: DNA ligase [unclassified Limnohabitans]|jgi:DNA ligase-1|uniref:DNA ligase n=1 Tax=unclassified Limnohabitans TaxID=2626134 RepID=UPI000CF26E21|nr:MULTISPECIES: DNA ligase [unclassified Limnohabitans]PQA83916.1 DNA ligase [Limnohabitans sp. TS-CS-82]BDU55655.1 ATP-dependent DNA ligase [Limnohabitans sp. TEGF004]